MRLPAFRHANPTPGLSKAEQVEMEAFTRDFERRLDRAFNPDLAAITRMRAVVLAEYRRRNPLPEYGRELVVSPRRGLVAVLLRPLASASLSLALLTGSASLAFAFSGPGQPFYGVRLGVETAQLPPVSAPARIYADVARLDKRLAEANTGAVQADRPAVDDSLGAYSGQVDGVVDNFGLDSTKTTLIGDRLAHDQVALVDVAKVKPIVATAPVQKALRNLAATKVKFEQKAKHATPGGGIPKDPAPSSSENAPATEPSRAPRPTK
jgi:hypothetical protein